VYNGSVPEWLIHHRRRDCDWMQLYHVVVVKPSHVPAAPAAAAAAGRNQSSIVGRRATATVAADAVTDACTSCSLRRRPVVWTKVTTRRITDTRCSRQRAVGVMEHLLIVELKTIDCRSVAWTRLDGRPVATANDSTTVRSCNGQQYFSVSNHVGYNQANIGDRQRLV